MLVLTLRVSANTTSGWRFLEPSCEDALLQSGFIGQPQHPTVAAPELRSVPGTWAYYLCAQVKAQIEEAFSRIVATGKAWTSRNHQEPNRQFSTIRHLAFSHWALLGTGPGMRFPYCEQGRCQVGLAAPRSVTFGDLFSLSVSGQIHPNSLHVNSQLADPDMF